MDNVITPQRDPVTIQRILDSARVILRRWGVEGLTIRSLAAELDVTPPALYTHVDGKQAIVSSLVTEEAEWQASLFERADNLMTRPVLITTIERWLDRAAEFPELYRLMELHDDQISPSESGGVERFRAAESFVRRSLTHHTSTPPNPLQVRLAALRLLAGLRGASGVERWEDAPDLRSQFVNDLVAGLQSPPEPVINLQ